jgi:zinc transporter ZupT
VAWASTLPNAAVSIDAREVAGSLAAQLLLSYTTIMLVAPIVTVMGAWLLQIGSLQVLKYQMPHIKR